MSTEQSPSSLERVLRAFLDDSALWPVLAVIVGVFATLGAALLVLVLQDRNLPAMAAVALLAMAGGHGSYEAIRRRRLGAVGALALAVVALGAIVAAAYVRLVG